MFSTFLVTMGEVVKSISITDVVRAFGNESMNLYYQSDPSFIKAFMEMFKIYPL